MSIAPTGPTEARARAAAADPLARPIVFFGAPRSGTSILSDAVMRHPDIAFPSQYAALFPRLVRLNHARPLLDNGRWRVIGTKDQLNATRWYNRYVFRPGECYPLWSMLAGERFATDFLLGRRASAAERARIRSYFEALVRHQRRTRLAIKLTGPSRLEFLSGVFPDALYVRIRRRPLPTVRSLLRVGFWRNRQRPIHWTGAYDEREIALMERADTDPALVTALQVRRIEEVADAECARLGVDVLEVRYEDFVEAPARTVSLIAERAGLAPSPAILDFGGAFAVHRRGDDAERDFSEDGLALLRRVLDGWADERADERERERANGSADAFILASGSPTRTAPPTRRGSAP